MRVLVAKPTFISLLLMLYQSSSKGIKHRNIKQHGQRKGGKSAREGKKTHALNGGKSLRVVTSSVETHVPAQGSWGLSGKAKELGRGWCGWLKATLQDHVEITGWSASCWSLPTHARDLMLCCWSI